MNFKVLLIEDDPAFRKVVKNILVMNGYSVTDAGTGKIGIIKALEEQPDLIVLDLILPGMNGFEVCKELKMRINTAGIPILILTGNDKDGQDIACLDMGADNYLIKPVKSECLLAHCHALLRHTQSGAQKPDEVRLGPLQLNYKRKLVKLYTMEYSFLTPKEFGILYELAVRSPLPLDRETLYRLVWGMEPPSEASMKTIEVHIRRIRLKMSWWSDQWLTSIHGRGYSLVQPDIQQSPTTIKK